MGHAHDIRHQHEAAGDDDDEPIDEPIVIPTPFGGATVVNIERDGVSRLGRAERKSVVAIRQPRSRILGVMTVLLAILITFIVVLALI